MAREMFVVRKNYGVPAYRGKEIVFFGGEGPIKGRILSCDGSYLYVRTEDGKRLKLHPTWKINYGDNRDYGAEMSLQLEIFNDWVNEKIDEAEYIRRIKAVPKIYYDD